MSLSPPRAALLLLLSLGASSALAGDSVDYHWNEATNPGGPNRCTNSNQCDGMRKCSASGWCEGTARPGGCVPDNAAAVNGYKYNRVFQKACHNCYEKKYATTFKSTLDYTHNVEVDFWDTRDAVSGAKDHSWFVRHNPGTLFQSGNDNNCTGDGTGKNDLAACLGDVASWSDAHPGHAVITVFLDKKQDWGKTREPADLDALLLSKLGRARIFAPADLKGSHPNLRAAATAGNWPSMQNLNGKVLLVMTGGQSLNHNKTMSTYVEKRGDAALMFVATDADNVKDVNGTPEQFNAVTAAAVVFYNVKTGNKDVSENAYDKNYASRVWGATENNATYNALLSQCVAFIALYNYKETGFNDGHMEGVFKDK